MNSRLSTKEREVLLQPRQFYEEFRGRRLDSIRGYQNTLSSFINTLSSLETCVNRNCDSLSKILSILKIIASIGVSLENSVNCLQTIISIFGVLFRGVWYVLI